MAQQYNKKNSIYLILVMCAIVFSSCLSYKRSLYFQGDQQTLPPVKISEVYKLHKRDIIQVKIFTPDPASSETLHIGEVTSNTQPEAYFNDTYINDSGYVEIPLTGKLYVEGYTISQVDSLITVKAKEYFNIYTVDVKLASFKFLALGEFRSPGEHFVANETCTIYQAIAIAEDVTDYANKTKIQIIRPLSDGSQKIFHLDLTDYSGFTQENYYIQPNDIIYMQPQKAKIDKQNITLVTVALAGISTLLLILRIL